MRQLADTERIRRFIQSLSLEAEGDTSLYFTGGATAVLLGWRSSTIDVDILIIPDSDRLYRVLPRLKEELEINVELASPSDFIPEVPGWQSRSVLVVRERSLSVFHYDLYSQALAKIERSHAQDLRDVGEMLRRGLIDPGMALGYFEAIEPNLYRYPAIDPRTFRQAVREILGVAHE